MKLFEFHQVFGNKLTILNELRIWGLLGLQPQCEVCGDLMVKWSANKTDGVMLYCQKRSCRKAKSVRYDSFFEGTKMSLQDCMLFLHLWGKGYPAKLIVDDFQFSKQTVVDWSRFCRDLCVFHFESDISVVGGPGCIVEIDETLAVKRKYERGRVLAEG
jgi:hypothetical protein